MSDEDATRQQLMELVGRLPAKRLPDALKYVRRLVEASAGSAGSDESRTASPAPAAVLTPEPAQPPVPVPSPAPADAPAAAEAAAPGPELKESLDRAVAAVKTGQWGEALEYFEKSLALQPDMKEQLAPYRATCFVRYGFPDLAAKVVSHVRPEKLSLKETYVLARIMREARAFLVAEKLLMRVASRDPTNQEVKSLLSKVREEAQMSSDPVIQMAQRSLAPLIAHLELVARGGMAIVCRGYHQRLKCPVAVKVMLPQFKEVPGAEDRFLLEAITLVNLKHPNLVEAFSVYRNAKITAYSMELLENAVSCEHSVKSKGPFPWPEALKFLVAVTDALSLCHKRNVVHRDIKPDNILFLADGRIKLIDLGAADFGSKLAGQQDLFQGTLRYSAPEALLRRAPGPPADLYSLAVVFHDLVMGLALDTSVPPDPMSFPDEARDNLRTRGVGRLLRDMLHRCLDPDPKKRYPDASALRTELAKLPLSVAALPGGGPTQETGRVSDSSSS